MNIILKNLPVFVLILFAACQKKDNTPVDLSKVNVTFNELSQGQIFHKGDTVNIDANVSYPAEIVGIGVQITDSATGALLFQDDQDTHTNTFLFQRSWVDTLSDTAALQVKIFVFVANNASEPAERSLHIRTEP